jgi:heme oxygenase
VETLGFADLARERTTALHQEAEQSGIVAAIISGRVRRDGYTVYVRNLLPVYVEMEKGLLHHESLMRGLFRPELLRAPALERDLTHLAGKAWETHVPLLTEGTTYARRLVEICGRDPALLVEHVYTRYLGDLAGGTVLRSRLSGAGQMDPSCLSFYTFPEIGDARRFAREYRAAIDATAATLGAPARLVEEAIEAFRLNIALSMAVQRFVDAAPVQA